MSLGLLLPSPLLSLLACSLLGLMLGLLLRSFSLASAFKLSLALSQRPTLRFVWHLGLSLLRLASWLLDSLFLLRLGPGSGDTLSHGQVAGISTRSAATTGRPAS